MEFIRLAISLALIGDSTIDIFFSFSDANKSPIIQLIDSFLSAVLITSSK